MCSFSFLSPVFIAKDVVLFKYTGCPPDSRPHLHARETRSSPRFLLFLCASGNDPPLDHLPKLYIRPPTADQRHRAAQFSMIISIVLYLLFSIQGKRFQYYFENNPTQDTAIIFIKMRRRSSLHRHMSFVIRLNSLYYSYGHRYKKKRDF